MSAARKELAALIAKCFRIHPNGTAYLDHAAGADAIIAAGYTKPRTITTVEELDALPNGSFIETEQGGYWQADKRGHGEIWWLEPGNPRSSLSEDLTLPATVLWEVSA